MFEISYCLKSCSKEMFKIKKQMKWESKNPPLGEVRSALNNVAQRANVQTHLVNKRSMYQSCLQDRSVQSSYGAS